LFAAKLINTHDNVPAGGLNVRITGDVGQVVGRDRLGYPTTYLTLILSEPTGQDENGLPIRNAKFIYPGC
jgi:hypothetical protein